MIESPIKARLYFKTGDADGTNPDARGAGDSSRDRRGLRHRRHVRCGGQVGNMLGAGGSIRHF